METEQNQNIGREKIEKMFDSRYMELYDMRNGKFYGRHDDIKDFIFQEVIPEVLREVIKNEEMNQKGQFEDECGNVCWYLDDLKKSTIRIAKERYGIDI